MLEGNKYNEEELDKETSSETEDTGFFGSLTSMFSQD
jgi:hypothetical protein